MRPDRRKRARSRKISVFKEVEETPSRYLGTLCPTNLNEQKERFLKFGIVPKFKMRSSQSEIDKITAKKKGQIRFDYLPEAKFIIEKVKEKIGDGQKYFEMAFGPPTDFITGTEILAQYLLDCNCEGEITVYWTQELECSAKMMWHGPNLRYNKPEARRFTLIIKNSMENQLMRELGIQCLADHEIGTHYMRMINDGLQPWFSDRKKFGLRPMSCREGSATEEGLATINTVLNSKSKYIWKAAITYYTACMAAEMSFLELFQHLETYIKDPEQRWKQVMRVKRGLADCNSVGGYGHDQIYFEGAVEIIRNLEQIDFNLLYSGKVCIDELPRIRRLARLDCIKTPRFLRDIEKYKRMLRQIGYVNGLIQRPERKTASKPEKSSPTRPARKPTGDDHKSPSPSLHKRRNISSSFPRSVGTPAPSISPSPPLYHTKPAPPFTRSSNNFIYPSSPSTFSRCFKCGSSSDEENDEDTEVTSVDTVCMPTPTGSGGQRLLLRPQNETNKLGSPSADVAAQKDGSSSAGDWFGLMDRKTVGGVPSGRKSCIGHI